MAFALLENGIVFSVVEQIPEEFSGQAVDVGDNTNVLGWKLDGNVLNDGSLDCLIYDFVTNRPDDKKIPPFDLDFLTSLSIKLHRKQTMVKGEIKVEEYYKDFNGTVYSGLVVKESNVYTRDSFGFAQYRTTTVEWILKNGQTSDKKKIWKKYYDSLQMIEEGVVRRGNIVKYLQPVILTILMQTSTQSEMMNIIPWGRSFLSYLKSEFDNFVDHSDKAIISRVDDEDVLIQFPWLTRQIPNTQITILQYIISELTI